MAGDRQRSPPEQRLLTSRNSRCRRLVLQQAFGAVFVLIGAWVAFRFLGPAVGLYTLKNGFTEVPDSLL